MGKIRSESIFAGNGRLPFKLRWAGCAIAALCLLLVLGLILHPARETDRSATALPGVSLGSLAPDFTLRDVHGRPVSLRQFRGRPVLLNFWATSCTPCLTEMPALRRAYQQFSRSGVHAPVILGVDGTTEDGATIARFANRLGVTYPLLLDPLLQVTIMDYHVVGLPSTVLLGADGRVRSVHVGPMSYTSIVHALASSR